MCTRWNKNVALYYVDNCVYWYTSEALGKLFLGDPGNRFHVKLLGYSHWFMSIRISEIRDHPISVDQDIYYTYIVAKYLYTATVNTSTKFYNATFPSDMIFIKDDAYTSDYKVYKLTRSFNIHCRACIGSLVYL